MIGMNCLIEEEQEIKEHGDIKIINTLSELISNSEQNQQQPPTTLRSPGEIETDTKYVDEFSNEFSEPIDIETEINDENNQEFIEEDNEISDGDDSLETEFIRHETEPLLQDFANQMINFNDQSSTTVALDDEETTPSSISTVSLIGANEQEATKTINAKNDTKESAELVKKKYEEKLNSTKEETITEPSSTSSTREDSSSSESIVDSTSAQAILELAFRSKNIEPNAHITSSNIENVIHVGSSTTIESTTTTESSTQSIRRKQKLSMYIYCHFCI